MTDAIVCRCGCGTLQLTEADAEETSSCNCGCGTTATHLPPEEEIDRLRHLRESVDERLQELEKTS